MVGISKPSWSIHLLCQLSFFKPLWDFDFPWGGTFPPRKVFISVGDFKKPRGESEISAGNENFPWGEKFSPQGKSKSSPKSHFPQEGDFPPGGSLSSLRTTFPYFKCIGP